MIDDKEFDFVSQNAHMCGGAVAPLAGYVLGGIAGATVAALAIILFAAIKEFWYDPRYETEEESGGIGGDWEDFSHYLIGVAVAGVIVAVKVWWLQ